MRPMLRCGALLLLVCPNLVLAQSGTPPAGPPVAFPQVTGIPIPLQSVSGRYSSLRPLNQFNCPYKKVSGRVVSPRLLLVKEMVCGRPGHDNVLLNVQFSNPADAGQMVVGRRVVISARFKNAEEDRDAIFVAEFLIAEKAELVSGDAIDPSAPRVPAFTSYMMCQPPELDELAAQLGRELCVQSTIVANLTTTRLALEAAARRPAMASPEDKVPDDADTISCRPDPGISDLNLSAIACARNDYWAWYQAKWRDPLSSTPAPP